MILTPQLLSEIGPALFGDDWEGEIAREIKRSKKTIERWRDGKTRIDPRVRGMVLALIEKRRVAINALWTKIHTR